MKRFSIIEKYDKPDFKMELPNQDTIKKSGRAVKSYLEIPIPKEKKSLRKIWVTVATFFKRIFRKRTTCTWDLQEFLHGSSEDQQNRKHCLVPMDIENFLMEELSDEDGEICSSQCYVDEVHCLPAHGISMRYKILLFVIIILVLMAVCFLVIV